MLAQKFLDLFVKGIIPAGIHHVRLLCPYSHEIYSLLLLECMIFPAPQDPAFRSSWGSYFEAMDIIISVKLVA